MIVTISATEREFRNTYPGIKKMFEWIDEATTELQAEFSHLVVDAVEVGDAPLEYVKKNRNDIKEIEVVLREKQLSGRRRGVKVSPDVLTNTIHVKISNIEFEVERTPAGLEEMSTRLNEAMNEFHVYFSHLVVDGDEVTDAPLEYVIENRDTVQQVEVIFLTAEQYIAKAMEIMAKFIESALPSIRSISDEFYARPDDGTWERFVVLLDGMNNIIRIIGDIVADERLVSRRLPFESVGTKLGEQLTMLLEAAEKKDLTFLADILRYEIIPLLMSLHTAVAELLPENRCRIN